MYLNYEKYDGLCLQNKHVFVSVCEQWLIKE